MGHPPSGLLPRESHRGERGGPQSCAERGQVPPAALSCAGSACGTGLWGDCVVARSRRIELPTNATMGHPPAFRAHAYRALMHPPLRHRGRNGGMMSRSVLFSDSKSFCFGPVRIVQDTRVDLRHFDDAKSPPEYVTTLSGPTAAGLRLRRASTDSSSMQAHMERSILACANHETISARLHRHCCRLSRATFRRARPCGNRSAHRDRLGLTAIENSCPRTVIAPCAAGRRDHAPSRNRRS